MTTDTAIETCRGVVYPWQLDHMDHMNVQFYTARFDEATWHLFAALGMTTGYFKTNRRGMAALEQRTLYKKELHAGALIRITSELLEMKPKTIRFVHRMYDTETGAEVATTELVGAHIDTDARKAVPFPGDIVSRQRSFIDGHAGSA
ncbi:MAG: thioesterase family protein [Burkholderiales bacterium]|nr:thioesterase family protein [Burkholderiales bacterium]